MRACSPGNFVVRIEKSLADRRCRSSSWYQQQAAEAAVERVRPVRSCRSNALRISFTHARATGPAIPVAAAAAVFANWLWRHWWAVKGPGGVVSRSTAARAFHLGACAAPVAPLSQCTRTAGARTTRPTYDVYSLTAAVPRFIREYYYIVVYCKLYILLLLVYSLIRLFISFFFSIIHVRFDVVSRCCCYIMRLGVCANEPTEIWCPK